MTNNNFICKKYPQLKRKKLTNLDEAEAVVVEEVEVITDVVVVEVVVTTELMIVDPLPDVVVAEDTILIGDAEGC